MRIRQTITVGAAVAFSLPATALSQVPTAILRSGQPIPGIQSFDFSGVQWLGTNHSGGLIANISGDNAGAFTSFLWGNTGGGALGELRRDGPLSGLSVELIVDECSGAGAKQAFLARVVGGTDSLFVDETAVVSLGDATGPAGATWLGFDEPFLDETDTVWFRGRYDASPNSRTGLFRGNSLTPVLLGGDAVAGLPGLVHTSGGPERGYDVSPTGAHWIGVVHSSLNRIGVVRDGQVLSAGAVPLVSGNMLPSAFQITPNESYNAFGQTQVAEGERWAVIGGTPTGFIVRDGDMFVRPGNIVDGYALTDDFRAIAMNRHGSLAWIGRIAAPGGQFPNAVFRERTLLYKVGDAVDVDGDGIADAGYTITEITGGEGRLAYTEDGIVWATVRMTTPVGGSPFAVIGVGDPFGIPYCSSVPNSTGRGAAMQAVGTPVLTDNALHLRCIELPANTFGLLLCSRTQSFVAGAGGSQGDLCLGGDIGRFNAQIANSGATGSFSLPVDLSAIPQPSATVTGTVGESWSFQFWYRDANPGATSNFSDGIEVILQ